MITKIKNFLLNFSIIFFSAAATSFTAYNWKIMTALQKLAIPSILITLSIVAYYFFKNEKYKNLTLLLACFLIGILFATFGQVYQTGANTWILFRNWSLFIIIPAILGASHAIFFLFLATTGFMSYFFLILFYDGSLSFFITSLILFVVLIIYPILSKKLKFKFNDNFYNSVLIIFYILFNIAGPFLIIDNYLNIDLNLSNISMFVYLGVLTLAHLIIYKLYKKVIVLPFSILSAGIFCWAILTREYRFFDGLSYFFMSLIIFFIISFILINNLSTFKEKFKNDFIVRIFKAVGGFLKFLILILAMIIFIFLMPSNLSFLLVGILLLWFSFSSYAELKKENKLEFLSFTLSIISFNIFFIRQFNLYYNLDEYTLSIASINLIIFYIFWYFNFNKTMDLIFTQVNYVYLLIVFNKFYIPSRLSVDLIINISLSIIFLELIFDEKIESSKFNTRIKRIIFGNNIALFFWTIIIYTENFTYLNLIDHNIFLANILYYLKNYLSLILIILIIFISLKDSYLKNNISSKINLKNFYILSIVFSIIWYIAHYIPALRFLILLLLLYIYKNKKWTSFLLSLATCFYIFYHYYRITWVTLLDKSIYMFYLALVLLAAYLITKFFIRGVDSIEEKN